MGENCSICRTLSYSKTPESIGHAPLESEIPETQYPDNSKADVTLYCCSFPKRCGADTSSIEILPARAGSNGAPRVSPEARYFWQLRKRCFPRSPVLIPPKPGTAFWFPLCASVIETCGLRRYTLLGSANAFFLLNLVQLVKILHGCSDDCGPIRGEPPTLEPNLYLINHPVLTRL